MDVFCTPDDACTFGHYISALKTSVTIILLLGGWQWLFGRAAERASKHRDDENALLNSLVEPGDRESANGLDGIYKAAEGKVNKATAGCLAAGGACSLAILTTMLFVHHDTPVTGLWLWLIIVVAVYLGPLLMASALIYSNTVFKNARISAHEFLTDLAGKLKQPTESIPSAIKEGAQVGAAAEENL